MTIEDAKKWLKTAPVGSRFPYHEGYLAADREPLTGAAWREAGEIANLMWDAYTRGKVTLTQERTGHGQFRYWAHKRRR